MRIELNSKATEKALKAAGQLDRSANDLTNLLLESIEEIEIVQIVSMKFRASDGSRKVVKRSRRWLTDFR